MSILRTSSSSSTTNTQAAGLSTGDGWVTAEVSTTGDAVPGEVQSRPKSEIGKGGELIFWGTPRNVAVLSIPHPTSGVPMSFRIPGGIFLLSCCFFAACDTGSDVTGPESSGTQKIDLLTTANTWASKRQLATARSQVVAG